MSLSENLSIVGSLDYSLLENLIVQRCQEINALGTILKVNDEVLVHKHSDFFTFQYVSETCSTSFSRRFPGRLNSSWPHQHFIHTYSSLTFLLFLPWQPSPTLQLLAPLSLSLSLSLSLYLSLSPSPSLLSSPFPFYIFSLSFFSLLHYLLFTVLCSNGISYSF